MTDANEPKPAATRAALTVHSGAGRRAVDIAEDLHTAIRAAIDEHAIGQPLVLVLGVLDLVKLDLMTGDD